MSKELYEAIIEYTKDYNGESWIATISDEKYIDMDTFERVKADLEAKLAEKEQIIGTQYNGIEYWKSVAEKRPDIDYVFKIKDLEQQLAEKEKEITKLKSDNHSLMSDNAYQEADIFELKQKLAIQNQDKISFAVEQLEEVKDYAQHIQGGLINYIDDQIKQLKEMK